MNSTETPQIIWEDDDLLVADKPVGLLVDSGGRGDDLVAWARASGFGSSFAFHRLDRETSGLVLMGKTRKLAREITALFEEKRIRKNYLAVVGGGAWPLTLNRIDEPIEDRTASTTFRRLAVSSMGGETLLDCLPKTGRTHQIRIHCAGAGHPILGDRRYGTPLDGVVGHALHAYRLDFRHPSNGETVSLRSRPEGWKTTWLSGFDVDKIWEKLAVRQANLT